MDSNRMALATMLGVYATFALDVFSTLNSSPQTTELAAEERGESLGYWVGIGSGAAIAGGAIATLVTGSLAPLIVTALISGGMVLLYVHAAHRGGGKLTPDSVA